MSLMDFFRRKSQEKAFPEPEILSAEEAEAQLQKMFPGKSQEEALSAVEQMLQTDDPLVISSNTIILREMVPFFELGLIPWPKSDCRTCRGMVRCLQLQIRRAARL